MARGMKQRMQNNGLTPLRARLLPTLQRDKWWLCLNCDGQESADNELRGHLVAVVDLETGDIMVRM